MQEYFIYKDSYGLMSFMVGALVAAIGDGVLRKLFKIVD